MISSAVIDKVYLESHATLQAPANMNVMLDEEFALFKDLIYRKSGIHLTHQKKALLKNRIFRRLSSLGIGTYRDYYSYIKNDSSGCELDTLINLISTCKTDFMREEHHFEFLTAFVQKNLTHLEELYIWSAGCSTGEEPYSIMFTLEKSIRLGAGIAVKILATDINTRCLDAAESGLYSTDKLKPLSRGDVGRFFQPAGKDRYRIRENYRSLVQFRYLNLVEAIPFRKRFDFIFCRNVMIYFDRKTQQDLVERLYSRLKAGGFLFIGHSESLKQLSSDFIYVQPSIYQKPLEVP